MSDWVNDYQKLYFEFKLLNLISMFDIFLRILENSFKFRCKQRVAQSQRQFLRYEELNRNYRVTGGDTHNYTTQERVRIRRFYSESKLIWLICKFAISFTNIRKFLQILFKQNHNTVATTYFSPAGNRTPVSRVTGGDTHHYTTEE